ncbi:hypothetical protein MWT71_003409 [Vibrio parahaemolyticus]|nr:hypothetical protein [Vibrio parahaemolyticus]EHH1248579.1 hypothetical protein [Vibrio parahaemolyticus]EHW0631853.1 hypothetical protein [Vibrio parahaemolyticus]EJA3304312.1 hypothetical protein [Vibrio parahaemolyticus]EJG0665279.1 hypothetical protein [Vibrio parahaemolyticus]
MLKEIMLMILRRAKKTWSHLYWWFATTIKLWKCQIPMTESRFRDDTAKELAVAFIYCIETVFTLEFIKALSIESSGLDSFLEQIVIVIGYTLAACVLCFFTINLLLIFLAIFDDNASPSKPEEYYWSRQLSRSFYYIAFVVPVMHLWIFVGDVVLPTHVEFADIYKEREITLSRLSDPNLYLSTFVCLLCFYSLVPTVMLFCKLVGGTVKNEQ